MDRTRSLAAPLLALVLLGYAHAPLAAPPPPPDGCLSDDDCDDGDLCNGVERCVKPEDRPGRCRPGVGRVCQDLDPCTSDVCVANECIHEPIPDCPASTTTSTSTTSTTTVTTTTSSLPTMTTSTTGPPTTATTSTTLPSRPCVPPDPAACDDGATRVQPTSVPRSAPACRFRSPARPASPAPATGRFLPRVSSRFPVASGGSSPVGVGRRAGRSASRSPASARRSAWPTAPSRTLPHVRTGPDGRGRSIPRAPTRSRHSFATRGRARERPGVWIR